MILYEKDANRKYGSFRRYKSLAHIASLNYHDADYGDAKLDLSQRVDRSITDELQLLP